MEGKKIYECYVSIGSILHHTKAIIGGGGMLVFHKGDINNGYYNIQNCLGVCVCACRTRLLLYRVALLSD